VVPLLFQERDGLGHPAEDNGERVAVQHTPRIFMLASGSEARRRVSALGPLP